VYRIKSVCDARDVPHPMIVSESGRAIAAHHSLLVFDTLGCSKLDQFNVTGRPDEDYHGKEEVPQPVRDLFDSYRSVNERRLVECYHDGLQAREQALQMFNLGYLSWNFAPWRKSSTGRPAPRFAIIAASSIGFRKSWKTSRTC